MTYKSAIKILVMVFTALWMLVSLVHADALDDIRKNGEVVIGVRADRAPFGFRDPSGQLIGLEIDLAKDIAKRIGVPLRLLPVVPSNRLQFLQENKIDAMIATMAITDARRKAIGVIEPSYFASGIAVLAARNSGIASPSDLRDKTICALKSAFYLSQVEKMTGKALLTFKRVSYAEKALLSGKCAGFVYYDADLIYEKKSKKKWENFNIVRLNTPLLRWGLGVRRENKNTALGKLLSETVKDWHTKGTLPDLEKKWLGQTMNHLSEGIDKAKISQ